MSAKYPSFIAVYRDSPKDDFIVKYYICKCGNIDEDLSQDNHHACKKCGNRDYLPMDRDTLNFKDSLYKRDKNTKDYCVLHIKEQWTFDFQAWKPKYTREITRFTLNKREALRCATIGVIRRVSINGEDTKLINENISSFDIDYDSAMRKISTCYLGKELVEECANTEECMAYLIFWSNVPSLYGNRDVRFIATAYSDKLLQELKIRQAKTLKDIADTIVGEKDKKILKRLVYEKLKIYRIKNLFGVETGLYNPVWDYEVCRVFSNHDNIYSLLSLEWDEHLWYGNIDPIPKLLTLYGENRVTRFLVDNHKKNRELLQDTMTLLRGVAIYDKEWVGKGRFLKKHHLKLKPLHDELVKLRWMPHDYENIVFKYPMRWLAYSLKVDDYSFRLPIDRDELESYGQKLSNCLGAYLENIMYGYGFVVGMFLDDKLINALYLSHRLELLEYSGKYNNEPTQKEKQTIFKYHRAIRKIKNSS